MKLFAAACLASAFAESDIPNRMERFRRDAGYETISFIDSKFLAIARLNYEKQTFFRA